MKKQNIQYNSSVTSKLLPAQYKALSEIAGNAAVAWFAAGIISPTFIGIGDISKLILFLAVGFFASGFFVWLSVVLAKGVSNE